MITICYHCKREIDGNGIPFGKPIIDQADVSHGICVSCEEVERDRLRKEADELKKRASVGRSNHKLRRNGYENN